MESRSYKTDNVSNAVQT